MNVLTVNWSNGSDVRIRIYLFVYGPITGCLLTVITLACFLSGVYREVLRFSSCIHPCTEIKLLVVYLLMYE